MLIRFTRQNIEQFHSNLLIKKNNVIMTLDMANNAVQRDNKLSFH